MTRAKKRFHHGPWPGGVNLSARDRYISDQELAVLVNLDVRNDGILKPRVPCRILDYSYSWDYTDPTDVEQGVSFSNAATMRLLGKVSTYSVDNTLYTFNNTIKRFTSGASPVTVSYTGVTLDSNYRFVLEYNDFAYFVNDAPAKSFRISSTNAAAGGAVTLTPNLPVVDQYSQALMFKDRMFIFQGNRVYYSKATDPTLWSAASGGGFFDVNPDTSNVLTSMELSNDTLYLFKKDQTYAFSFVSDPATDGTLRVITPDKGATFTTTHENVIYTTDAISVYRFLNGFFEDIATKVNSHDARDGAFYINVPLFVWDNRLYVGFYAAMNLDTGAWTTYQNNPWTSVGPVRVIKYDTLGYSAASGYVLLEGYGAIWYLSYVDILTGNAYPLYYDSYPHPEGTKYIFPDYLLLSKRLTFGDQFSWKRYYKGFIDNDLSVHGGVSTESAPLLPTPSFALTPFDATLEDGTETTNAFDVTTTTFHNGYFAIQRYLRNTKNKLITKSFRFRELRIQYYSTDVYQGNPEIGPLEYTNPTIFYVYTYNTRDPSNESNQIIIGIPEIREIVIDYDMKAEADK